MNKRVTSKDGTAIALDRVGEGPAVVIVSGALGGRVSNTQLASLLAPRFTVLNYDRRGRGESGDADTYAVEREIEDLQAVITGAGGSAFVFGTSSGGNLVLESAARGVPMTKLAVWEANALVDSSRPPLPGNYVAHVRELVAAGRRGDAVEYFMTAAVGMPAEFVTPMRAMPMWAALEVAAHTLAYDGTVVGNSLSGKKLSAERWGSITAPVLVMDGGTAPWLHAGADAIAAALPNAQRLTLQGQTHDVAPTVLAPALIEFFQLGDRS